MKSNIVLIGMPAAGKSTVGVVLAKTIGYSFLDTDLIIQNEQNEKLFKIIENQGIDEFLKIENDCIKNISVKNTVIATGGSAVFGKEAMENLKKSGTIVYLSLPVNEISSRLNNIKTRGIAMKPNETIEELFREREPLYKKYADITVGADKNTESTVEEIIKECIN